MKVGTICARNYLPSALLLAESLHQVHPDWTTSILLVDIEIAEKTRYQQDYPEIEWLAPEDLLWSDDVLDRMKFYYNVVEFATALKPALLELLLDQDDLAMYLDPDIEVFNDLFALETLARDQDIVLLPHVTMPVPRDDLDPREETFLLSGQFNLGFVAVSQAAKPFLSYWNERLEFFSRIDHSNGYFTDQRWVDAVPSLFRNAVVREPGYNVAYWNLHEHDLTYKADGKTDEDVLVSGEPLKFFHYSGHSAANPLELSKFAPNPRVVVEQDEVLQGILVRRAGRMTNKAIPVVPYRWNRLPDGRPIAQAVRRGYWDVAYEAMRSGTQAPPSPFASGSKDEFTQWLEEPTQGDLPRLALLFWKGSPLLAGTFKDSSRESLTGLCSTLLDDQEFLMMSTPQVLRSLESIIGRVVPIKPGFNIAIQDKGKTLDEMSLVHLIRLAGFPVWEEEPESLLSRGPISNSFPYCINVEVIDPRPQALSVGAKPRHPLGASIGVWEWDYPGFAASIVPALNSFNEIWCKTEFERSVLIAGGVRTPIFVIPPFVYNQYLTKLERADLGIDSDAFVVGAMFEVASDLTRANIDGVIATYCSAFGPEDGNRLVVVVPPGVDVTEVRSVSREMEDRSDIIQLELDDDTYSISSVIQLFDAYVSLERCGGMPRRLIEAVSSGVPIVFTGWSGAEEVLGNLATSVPCEMTSVGRNAVGCSEDTGWATPDLETATLQLRDAAAERSRSKADANAVREEMFKMYSEPQVVDWVVDRFDSIMEGNAWQR